MLEVKLIMQGPLTSGIMYTQKSRLLSAMMKPVHVNPHHVKKFKKLDDNNPNKNDRKAPKTIEVRGVRYSELVLNLFHYFIFYHAKSGIIILSFYMITTLNRTLT